MHILLLQFHCRLHACTPYLVFSHLFFLVILLSISSTIHPISIHISAFSPPASLPIFAYLKSRCFIESCGSLTDKRWWKCCDTVLAEGIMSVKNQLLGTCQTFYKRQMVHRERTRRGKTDKVRDHKWWWKYLQKCWCLEKIGETA